MRVLIVGLVGACSSEEGSPPPPPDDTPAPDDTSAPLDTDPPTVPPPNTFSAEFLWAPFVLDGAIDLGHVPAPVATPVEPGPVTLTRVTAGLGASSSGGDAYGVGIAFVDVDADGWDDLFVASGQAPPDGVDSSLWRNAGDGTFEDISASSGIAAILGGRDALSVAAGDVDLDGDVDLYAGAHPTDVLLLGAGDGTFTDGTLAAGAGGPPSAALPNRSKMVGLGDYDGDGHLDLVSASDTFVTPGANLYVLRGIGGGLFEDTTVTTGAFAPDAGTPCAVMWSDHDADGLDDLVVWNDGFGEVSANRVLLKSAGSALTDVTAAVGWTNPLTAPMGIDAADIDRDDWIDWFVGDAANGMLLLSNADGPWIDWTAAAGIDTPFSWGLGFEDLDADGWWDLFAAEPGPFPHLVYRHLRSDPPMFTESEVLHPAVAIGNVAAAFADWDHDGDTDIALAGTGGETVSLYRNDTDRGTARWLEVRVDAAPGDGATGGVSARVVVSAGGIVLWRDIPGGSSRGSQNALSARFGLGHHTGADWVGVLWPDGRQVVAANVPGDATVLFDGDGAALR